MTDEREYGVGIIGCGFIGKVHAYAHTVLPYFYDLPFRTRLVGICTAHEETAEAARRRFGFDGATTDSAALIERPDIDVVHVCTPNAFHRDDLLRILAAGKHVYCDKPLTPDWPSSREVLAALDGYGGVHQMTFQNRFYPATMRAKQLVDEGALGELTCLRAVFLHSSNVDRLKPHGWKFGRAGGILNDVATHVVDLVQHLVGPFDEVFCAGRVWADERPAPDGSGAMLPVEVADHVCMTVRQDAGLVGTIEATKLATGVEDELRFEIHGTRGALRFNLMEADYLDFYDATAPGEPMGGRRGFTRIGCVQRFPAPATDFPYPKSTIGWLRSHVASLYSFMDCVHCGRKAEPGLEVGAALERFVDAAGQSNREGRSVRPTEL